MPLSEYLRQGTPPEKRLSARTAKTLVGLMGVLVAALDLITPAEYQINVLYGIAIAMCVWSESRRFLWRATITTAVLVLLGHIPKSASPLQWSIILINFSLTIF